MKFKVGDRATRPQDVYKQGSPLMHGTVIKVYSMSSKFGFYPELYKVDWDGGTNTTKSGYLPHGLDHE